MCAILVFPDDIKRVFGVVFVALAAGFVDMHFPAQALFELRGAVVEHALGAARQGLGVALGSVALASADLASGRLDAQLSDSLQALEGFLSKPEGKGFAFLGGDQNDLECFGEGAGIAVRKGEDDLREAFNAAIKAVRANGTYKTLNDKYFKIDIWGG